MSLYEWGSKVVNGQESSTGRLLPLPNGRVALERLSEGDEWERVREFKRGSDDECAELLRLTSELNVVTMELGNARAIIHDMAEEGELRDEEVQPEEEWFWN